MRRLATLNSQAEVSHFCDYLVSEQISFRVDSEGEEFVLWILDEDHLEKARESFKVFQENPEDARFENVTQKAEIIRSEKVAQIKNAQQNQVHVRQHWERPQYYELAATYFLIFVSVLVTLKYFADDNKWGIFSKMTIVEIHDAGGNFIGWRGTPFQGQNGEYWRLITPIFPHLSPLHLLFNMYWTYLFGQILEPRLKSWRFLILVCCIAIGSNVIQFYWSGNPAFGGMSGVLYGLFGFTWAKRDWEPDRGIYVDQQTVYLLVGWMFFCMLGLMPIANAAHVSGLIIGYLIAMIRPALRGKLSLR